ncbi:MAG TPA: HAMP domain-containing sensor histidine kinase [Candidatus Baltobacteraceae bacterium]|nr:HAMP domain-containing sensor histidine kinase [Candidatus Baltobacteraceae bacterium]
MIAQVTARYLALFLIVLAVLSAGAYLFLAQEYGALLAPALSTPEGHTAYAAAMRKVTLTILAFDIPLAAVFGAVAWGLARASLKPLIDARERERAFAADAAHALRSPLATIAALSQTQKGEPFETITRAALDASATVGDLLTLARDAHGAALQCEPVDVAAVVRDTVREFESRAQAAGLTLRCEMQSAIAQGDERRIREVTRNLIENALRHARSQIRVCVQPVRREVEIAVWNDGEDLEEETKPKLFERFYTNGDPGGSGLGLAIVAWVARAHGGTALVRDRAGGPEFVVTLPQH